MTYLATHTDLPAPLRPSPLILLTGVSLAMMLAFLVWMPFDARMVGDAPAWAKPLKFATSFVVLFATLALVEARLGQPARQGWLMRGTVAVMGTAMVTEMAYITHQAAIGRASHYNMDTPFEAFMYFTVMAVGAVLLVAGIGVIGWIVARDRAARLSPALRQGIVWGFGLSFVLTLITAGTLSTGTGHHIGTPVTGETLIFGWSAEVGDLRPAHFLALHAMQALPLLGLLLDRVQVQRPARLITIAAVGYTGLTLAVFVQALMGLPLIAL